MENKETFQARFKPFLSPSQQLDIKLAYTLAKFGHRAQIRKELVDGKPIRYFEHVRRVAIILMDDMKIIDRDMIIVALLHDSLEDTEDLTAELLEHSFGDNVVGMVTRLSKIPKEGYHERLQNCQHWQTLAIKMCDRLDNLRSLMVPGVTLEFQKRQIQETKEKYFPIFDRMVALAESTFNITGQNHCKHISNVRDEIKRLIERYSTIIELQEQTNEQP